MLMLKTILPVYSFMSEYFYSLEGAPERSLALNKKLYTALSDRDGKASRKAMENILLYAENRVMTEVKKKGIGSIKFS